MPLAKNERHGPDPITRAVNLPSLIPIRLP